MSAQRRAAFDAPPRLVGREPVLLTNDRILKAEQVIDAVIEDWDERKAMTSQALLKAVEALFKRKKQHAWFIATFSLRGWEVLCNFRLAKAGYRRYGWGWAKGGVQR